MAVPLCIAETYLRSHKNEILACNFEILTKICEQILQLIPLLNRLIMFLTVTCVCFAIGDDLYQMLACQENSRARAINLNVICVLLESLR